MTLRAAIHRVVRRIPRGRVATYGQIAAVVGRPTAARAVGQAMRDCPPGVPWHRVVNARGGISPRVRMSGMLTQRLLLAEEGVRFRAGRASLRNHQWKGEGRHAARAEPQLLRGDALARPPAGARGRAARLRLGLVR
ncbi:MAG: MGMT family protein [Candidatus Rokubacteria bacterium]|nr:MGMT family protein [Candidatus Rokubacteria bacterium]